MKSEGLLVLAGGVFLGVIAIRGTWRQMFPFLVNTSQSSTPAQSPMAPASQQELPAKEQGVNPTNGKCPKDYFGPDANGKCTPVVSHPGGIK